MMTLKPIVSIILPVYNVEHWLETCLNSITKQTLRNIEIICVNDGSSDHSPQILLEYAKKDSRIRIVDQENKGLSEARNTGARAATGKYLYFMDSDDWLEPETLEICSKQMDTKELEFLCFNASAFGNDSESAKKAGTYNNYYKRYLEENIVVSGQELFVKLKQNHAFCVSACFCILLRSAFFEHNLWFHPSILHEDEPWMITVLMTLSRCGCINRTFYHRRIRNDSITQSQPTFAHVYGRFIGYLDVQNLLNNHGLSLNNECAELVYAHCSTLQKNAIRDFRSCNTEERLKQNDMNPFEHMLFKQIVELPASLMDSLHSLEKQASDNQKLKKINSSLNKQLSEFSSERQQLISSTIAIKASASYRLGHKMLFFPGKLKSLLKKNTFVMETVQKLRKAKMNQLPISDQEKNILVMFPSTVENNRIVYNYALSGEWQSYFKQNSTFEVEYPFNLEGIPESIRIIPFLAQILPVCWLSDAEIQVPECDSDFYNCLDSVKQGYCNMYPMLSFGGKLVTSKLAVNELSENNPPLVCFSGGVDATSTTLSHLSENPILVSLWGADVHWLNQDGWKPLEALLQNNAEKFGLKQIQVRSSFRDLLSEGQLSNYVKNSGDGWWHGFQHGLGILGHMAPVARYYGSSTIYIASSFTAEDKYTCASDPSIDNHVRFCGTKVVHDGYDVDRQEKIRRIVDWSQKNEKSLLLHVCWEKKDGNNCCHCEKCWRTILGLFVEGANPMDYGFLHYNGFELLSSDMENDYHRFQHGSLVANYLPIQTKLKKTVSENYLPQELSWLYRCNLSDLQNGTLRLHNGKTVPSVWLLGTPEHTNMGDHCIAEAEISFIQTIIPDAYICEISYKALMQEKYSQLKEIPPASPVFLQGSGSIGNLWPTLETIYEKIIPLLTHNPIVIFPSSIWFSDDKDGLAALARAQATYKGNNLLLCCRDHVSWIFAQEHFECPSILVPDMVMWEAKNPERVPERIGAMTLLRKDKERMITDSDTIAIEAVLAELFQSVDVSDMLLSSGRITAQNRKEKIDYLLRRIASVKCVVTDRLHGMILCAVTGTPCVVLANSYHKVEACYEWLKNLGYIRFIHHVRDLKEAVDSVCRYPDRVYPEKQLQSQFQELITHIENYLKG